MSNAEKFQALVSALSTARDLAAELGQDEHLTNPLGQAFHVAEVRAKMAALDAERDALAAQLDALKAPAEEAEAPAETFDQALARFVEHVTREINDERKPGGRFSNLSDCEITVMKGRRFLRIVKNDHGQRGVHCFIERETGDVYKAASWKAPAKHVRGNIFGDAKGYGVTKYGAAYLV